MSKKKEINFNLEPVDFKNVPDEMKIKTPKIHHIKIDKIKPVKINKVIIPKIEPVDKIEGYRYDKYADKMVKVDETEIEYRKKLLGKTADYIQSLYNRIRKGDKV